MLTLTRSVGERIYIGDDIVIEVRAILDGRQVRISIDAPRQVPIHRAEIFEAVSRQNRTAALEDSASRLAQLLGGTSQASEAVDGDRAGTEARSPGAVDASLSPPIPLRPPVRGQPSPPRRPAPSSVPQALPRPAMPPPRPRIVPAAMPREDEPSEVGRHPAGEGGSPEPP